MQNFLDEMKITNEEFDKSGLSIEELKRIRKDYDEYRKMLEPPKEEIINELNDPILEEVLHSTKSRIKKTDSLIRKIIRKKNENQKIITFENYKSEIKDLIGVRILHVLKEDLFGIHEKLMTFDIIDKPVMHHRKGDDVSLFKDNEIKKIERNDNYRSVHYKLKFKNYFAEIQVRTLIEEVWAETNHKLNYPNENKINSVINELNIINRICGVVDEMCLNVYSLDSEFKNKLNIQ